MPTQKNALDMIKDDFQIGVEFYTETGKWRCTDVGTRVVVAIQLDQEDPSWFAGPPYAVAEWVFDEYDTAGCSLDPGEFSESAEVPSRPRKTALDVSRSQC